MQGTQNSQNNLGEKKAGGLISPNFKNLGQSNNKEDCVVQV